MAKKVLMVIAFQGFRDEEYFEPKKILEQAGISVTTASTQIGIAQGKLGETAKTDITISQAKAADYDAVAFIGGPGSYAFFENKIILNLAKDAAAQGKVVAGICAAAAILAHAGLLKGIKATCFSGVADILKEKGANYSPSGLEVSGKIVTADGPKHARKFGQGIKKLLS